MRQTAAHPSKTATLPPFLQPLFDAGGNVTPNQALLVVQLLTQIRDGQHEVVALLKEQRPPPKPGDARYAELVAAIRAAIGDRVFSSAELIEHCDVAPELAVAITETVGGFNTRKVGRVLRRVEGMDLDGLRVARIGSDSNGVTWQIIALGRR